MEEDSWYVEEYEKALNLGLNAVPDKELDDDFDALLALPPKNGSRTWKACKTPVMVHGDRDHTCGLVSYSRRLNKLFCGGCFKYPPPHILTLFYISECIPFTIIEYHEWPHSGTTAIIYDENRR